MEETGTKRANAPGPDGMVTISGNGVAKPPSVTIPPDGQVEFTAEDPGPYLLQLFESTNKYFPPVFLVLTPNNPVIVQAGPNQRLTDCPYNVILATAEGKKRAATAGGGNKIIISS